MRAHWNCLFFTLSVAVCPSWLFLKPEPFPILPQEIEDALTSVNKSLSAVLDPVSLPGFVASVWYNGKNLRSWGVGVADKKTGRPPNPDVDTFRIASNTKLYTGLLAEIFAELGYMSLDDPVAKYCPAFAPLNPFDDGALITFRMLVSHTAGLPDSLPGAQEGSMTTAQVFSALQSLPLMVPTGTLCLYSNLGISLLGHILADYVAPKAEQGDLDFLLRKYILDPLALSANTGYNINSSVAARLIPAYGADGSQLPIEDIGWSAPCGTMWSTMPGLAQFHQITAATAAGTRSAIKFSPARAREWFQPIMNYPDQSVSIGHVWEIDNLNSFNWRTKSGTLNGFSSKSAVLPELRLSFAFAFNGNVPDWYTGDNLLKDVASTLGSAFAAVLPRYQPPRDPGPRPADYIGTYKQGGTSNVAQIATDLQGQLTFHGNFFKGKDTAVVLDFERNAQDVYRMFGDPTASSCEHVLFLDVLWASPIVFQRDPDRKSVV